MLKKIDIGQAAKVRILWKIPSTQYTREGEKSIIALFAQKYGISESNISVECVFTNLNNTNGDVALNSENIKSIQDPNFQHELFKQYLIDNEVTDYDWDALMEIDSRINALIDYNLYEKSKRYSIKWMKWKNFLSYGPENYFDFTKLHGLVLLRGEPSNKSGKSTFAYDLLHFLLFGRTKSGKADNLAGMFNSYLPQETEMFVEGCINIDGSDYVIKRTLTRPAKSKKTVRTATQKVEYYRILDNGKYSELVVSDTENLQGSSTTETSKIITEAIGEESDFDLIISANAKDLDDLISMKEGDRGSLLTRWIGLSCIEDKDEIARKIFNEEIKKQPYSLMYDRVSLGNEIETLKAENVDLANSVAVRNSHIIECEKKIADYNKNKDVLISSKRKLSEDIPNNVDITTLQNLMSQIEEQGKSYKSQLKDAEERLAAFGEVSYSEANYKKALKEKELAIEAISAIKSQISRLKSDNADLKNGEKCPTCGRPYDNVDNSGLIKANEEKIAALISKGTNLGKKREELIEAINEMDIQRQRVNEKNSLEVSIARLKYTIESQRNKYKEYRDIVRKLQDNEEAIKANNAIDAQVNVINETIKTETRVKDNENGAKTIEEQKIKSNEGLIADKESYILKLIAEETAKKNWAQYLKLIGKDGISKMVLKKTLPIINAELSNLLSDVADFDVEVSIDEKNSVNFWIIRDDVKNKLSAASGLEKTQAALALRVVLGNMSRLSKPPFVLFDEVLGTVAKENYDDMKKLYDKIVKNYDFILHICHIDLDWYNQVVTVKKVNNISSISSVESFE